MNFYIGSIRIGSVEGASCVNFGNNFPAGFKSCKKQNQGFGSISGDYNDIKDIVSQLKDSKVVDLLSSPEEDIPVQKINVVHNKWTILFLR